MGRARRPTARRSLGSTVSTGRLLSPLPLGLRDDEFFFTVHQITKLGAVNNTPPHQDFINLVSSDDDDIVVSQPPAKRTKTEETVKSDTHKDYVPLARCTLRFSRAAEDDAPPPRRLRRIPANSFYALRYSSGKGLSITARGRKVPAVSDGAFSPDDIGGLSDAERLILDHLAKKSTSVDPLPGCLFTAYFFSVDVDSNADTVSLVIDLELRWMLCSYVSNPMHSETERVWQARVLATLFPNVMHGGGHQYKNATDNDTWSPQDFYESAHVTRKDDDEPDDLYVPGLTANLFPFQRRAVKWLLRREGVRWAPDEATSVSRGTVDNSEPSVVVPYKAPEDRETTSHFVAVKDADGHPCYISELFGAATRDPSYFEAYENSIRGGILSEEMGLGKTVEVISLVLLHPRPADQLHAPTSPGGPTPSARPTGATLVIAPPALKNQWISEIQQHAPHLRVMVYSGMARSCATPEDEANVVEQFATHDVVVTTYSDLKSELHFAVAPPERNMRSQSDDVKRYRPRSPLVQMSWWRVCLDEAQEIENGVSNTATLVRIVPRVNAWGVTGTPVKDDVQDLRGLLLFLSYEPYASIPKVWQNLTRNHKRVFRNLFGRIALRHSKRTVGDELVIPPQKRYVITMPFTAVEEQHYQSLFKQLTEACGLDTAGAPLSPDWNPNDSAVLEAMRTALSRLRQTALHPEIGVHNPRVGHRAGPMRTVEEVLNAMIEQSESALLATRRAMLSCKLKHGQLFENSPRAKIAVDIWQDVLEESRALVQDARDKLEKAQKETALEEEAAGTSGPHKTSPGDESSDTEDDDDLLGDEDGRGKVGGRVGEAQRDLRLALEILHKAEFFCANGYFQIKSNAEWTRPDSDEFRRLEKLEVEGYERAKRVRQEILADNRSRAMRIMADLAGKAGTQGFVEIPETEFAKPEGIEGRRISDELDHLAEVLSTQAAQMDAWREAVIQLLLKDLVDDDEDKAGEAVEITGDEYEDSTKVQDEIQAYITILKAGISDRNMLLTGLAPSGLALYEERLALRMAKDDEGPAPELTLRLFAERQATLPKPTTGGAVVRSLRAAVIDLRDIASRLRGQLSSGSSLHNITSQRAQMELECVTRQLKRAQDEQTRQLKVNAALEKEANKVRNALNSRIAFYRQLQAVSDMVALYEGPKDEETIAAQIREENDLLQVLTKAEAKHRYLVHLKEAESKADESRMCVICQTEFWTGVLTVCGHQFCKECITLWFKAHRNCPVCKRKLTIDNLHDITLKRQALKVTDEHGGSNRGADRQGGRSQQGRQEQRQEQEQEQRQREQLAESKKANIYAAFSTDKLEEIKNIDLPGPSFTTKVDTIVRHLLWLRSTDPGAKSIVFSQYPAFLSILAEAFRRYHIAFSRYTDRNGIERFKDDPSIECFLLHARAHASGLNLVNASHVLLCEPLLNTAIELQAIARVHRIGQQHETTVWLYIVDGTVEASIYDLSVKRRMAHMGQDGRGGGGSSSSSSNNSVLQSGGKGKGRGNETPELLDSSLELANSLEMQQAQLSKLMSKGKMAGEEVAKGDLWTCLFGNASSNASEAARTALNEDRLRNDLVVRRHLTASAAEERQQHSGEGEASGSA